MNQFNTAKDWTADNAGTILDRGARVIGVVNPFAGAIIDALRGKGKRRGKMAKRKRVHRRKRRHGGSFFGKLGEVIGAVPIGLGGGIGIVGDQLGRTIGFGKRRRRRHGGSAISMPRQTVVV